MKVHFVSQVKDRANTQLLSNISTQLDNAYKESKKYLSDLRDDLCVAVTLDNKDDPWRGSSGFCGWEDFIEISLYKKYETGMEWVITNAMVATFFHESHHSVRWQTVGWGKTLLEGAISEGLATVYERESLSTNPAWGDYGDIPIEEWYAELVGAENDEFDHAKWFIKHPDGRQWIGYRVGVYLADQAIKKNPKETAASLAGRPAKEVIQLSGINLD